MPLIFDGREREPVRLVQSKSLCRQGVYYPVRTREDMNSIQMARRIREGERFATSDRDSTKAVTLNCAALINQGEGLLWTPSNPDAMWRKEMVKGLTVSPWL